ncbi:MAG TPA: hypothetical protein VF473_04255 [Cyclobacteriaceae bacterium]
MEGIHVLADFTCKVCSTNFYCTLPTGHDSKTPTAFTKDGKITRFDESAETWLARPLIDAMVNPNPVQTCSHEKEFKATVKENILLLKLSRRLLRPLVWERHVEEYCSPVLLAQHITEALKFGETKHLIKN